MKRRSFLRTTLALAAVAIVSTQAWTAPDRGLQFTPSGSQILANKDVGVERWAITLNNDDGTVTGNVFRSDGTPPAFLSCNPLAQPNSFACFGADPCSDGGTQRGIQETPDGKRILVNKDVGDERWAIAFNTADQTVTGNVFRAGDGNPAFIACDPQPAPNSFACSGADSCAGEPCADQFAFIDDVTLPSTFFQVPSPCIEPFNFISNVTLPADFFRLTTAGDFLSGVQTGNGTPGSLRVGAAPIPGPNPPATISGVAGAMTVTPGGMSNVTVSFGGGAAAAEANAVSSFLILAIADETCLPGNFVSGFYEIPLLTTSGQLSLSLTFSESLSGGNFVLCVTTIQGGVVGRYFDFPQSLSSCGNGQLEGPEACDPPAAQSQCPTGDICSNNCLQCVAATSCVGRCCPGRDDNCTPQGVQCFCDEFCVTANDCCEDALGECGFGSPAPTISNITQMLLQLNGCSVGGGQFGSLFAAKFDYTDPTGDVTPNGSVLDVMFKFQPSGASQSLTTNTIEVVSGNGSAGTLQLGQCYRFGNDSSVEVMIALRDDAGNKSNTLTVNTPRPQGGN